jgi:hypothetical protein
MYGITRSFFHHTSPLSRQTKACVVQTRMRAIHTPDLSVLQEAAGIAVASGYTAAITANMAKDMFHRFSARNTIIPPIPAPHPRLQMSEHESLQRIRTLFSSPDTVAAFHKIVEHMDSSCVGKDPSAWVGGHQCYKISTIAAVILKHAGFDPRICGVWACRNEAIGIDHAWVEVPLVSQGEASAIVVDLSCRQYTGAFRGDTDIEVPHGAIAPKPVFLQFVGDARHNWQYGSDLTSGWFEKSLISFETPLYRETPLSRVDIQHVFLGSESFLYGSQLFLKTRDFLLTFEKFTNRGLGG